MPVKPHGEGPVAAAVGSMTFQNDLRHSFTAAYLSLTDPKSQTKRGYQRKRPPPAPGFLQYSSGEEAIFNGSDLLQFKSVKINAGCLGFGKGSKYSVP
jgi:hypothetical protein